MHRGFPSLRNSGQSVAFSQRENSTANLLKHVAYWQKGSGAYLHDLETVFPGQAASLGNLVLNVSKQSRDHVLDKKDSEGWG